MTAQEIETTATSAANAAPPMIGAGPQHGAEITVEGEPFVVVR